MTQRKILSWGSNHRCITKCEGANCSGNRAMSVVILCVFRILDVKVPFRYLSKAGCVLYRCLRSLRACRVDAPYTCPVGIPSSNTGNFPLSPLSPLLSPSLFMRKVLISTGMPSRSQKPTKSTASAVTYAFSGKMPGFKAHLEKEYHKHLVEGCFLASECPVEQYHVAQRHSARGTSFEYCTEPYGGNQSNCRFNRDPGEPKARSAFGT